MTADAVVAAVSDAFEDCARRSIATRGRFACAVAGGSVAERVCPVLAMKRLPWSAVDVFLADERVVPLDDAASNARAVRAAWIDPLGSSAPCFHEMPTGDASLEQLATEAERELLRVLGTPPVLDVVLLGVGPDGHVASLFPDHPLIGRREAWVTAVDNAPKPPPRRLSLSLRTLAAGRSIWFIAFGPEKAAALREARTDPASTLPVAVVARSGPPVRWFLDDAADGARV